MRPPVPHILRRKQYPRFRLASKNANLPYRPAANATFIIFYQKRKPNMEGTRQDDDISMNVFVQEGKIYPT